MVKENFEKHLFYNYGEKLKKQVCPLGVLVGCVGTGKTTVFNLVTNKCMKTSNGGESMTRSVFSCPSGYGDRFQIMDTPGTFADEDKLSHAIHLRLALIEGPVSRIFLLIKFDRFGTMLRNLGDQLIPLQEWKNMITIIVTHWDREDTVENRKEYENTKNKILQYDVDLANSFIFVGKQANPKTVCKAFYHNLCINEPTQLKISDQDFHYRFDLYENMNFQVKQNIEMFNDISNNFSKEIMAYAEEDKDEFLHACIVNISQIAEQMIGEFSANYGFKMIEIDSYMHYMQLKAAFMPMVEKIRQLASSRMSYSLFDKKDPRNMFKACPHCKKIWVKVQGCDGQTTCGRRLDNDAIFDRQTKGSTSSIQFKFSWKNRVFKWIKEIFQFSSKIQTPQTQELAIKGIGCGEPFVWGDQPSVSKKILDDLKEAGLTDYFANYQEEKSKGYNEMYAKKNKEVIINKMK